MFIIPYIRKTTVHNNIQVNVLKILTIGGRYLWEESNELNLYQDILEPNGIFTIDTPYTSASLPHYYLCEVDTRKTILTDFYKWEELSLTDEETFCWKTYTNLTDADKNVWLQIPDTTLLSNCKVSAIIDAVLNK
jgi:hypothetical protein